MTQTHITAFAAAAALGLFAAATAQAQQQPISGTTFYGTLGYAGHDVYGADLGTVQGRLGARFGRFLGVEGEVAGGTDHSNFGGGASAGINDQEAIYGVGYLPLARNIDLFARIGGGHTDWNYKGLGHPGDEDRSWNYGAGAEWFFAGKNGIRAEYTKENFDHAPDADTWGVSFVRKF